MDYNLQKWIEPSFYNPFNDRMSPYPSRDFVNPGIGSVTSLFTFYEPIHNRPSPYAIDKKPGTD